jgi:excisionase family DNA binding protein
VACNTETRLLDRLLLTYDEAAIVLHMSKSYVQKLVRDGKLTAIEPGPQMRRIPRSEIDEYIARQVEEARAKADAEAA